MVRDRRSASPATNRGLGTASSVVTPSGEADDIVQTDAASQRSPDTGHTTVRDRWREESEERARELAPERAVAQVPHEAETAPRDAHELEQRFEMLASR